MDPVHSIYPFLLSANSTDTRLLDSVAFAVASIYLGELADFEHRWGYLEVDAINLRRSNDQRQPHCRTQLPEGHNFLVSSIHIRLWFQERKNDGANVLHCTIVEHLR